MSAADIDAAAGRVLAAKFRLGVFDPPAQVPFSAIGADVIGSDAHRALALEAAQKSARPRPPPAARRTARRHHRGPEAGRMRRVA